MLRFTGRQARRCGLAGLALCMVAFSTGGTSSAGTLAAGTSLVTLKVLEWEPGGATYWHKAVAAFESSHPGIKVQLESVPNNQYLQVEGPYISSRSGPDVMMNNAGLEIFQRAAAYQPINKLITPTIKRELLTYSGACLDFNTSNPCYGLPFSYQGNVMYYNKKVLREAGLNPNDPPRTWAQFGADCQAVNKIGKTCLALGLQGQYPSYWDFPEIARNYLTVGQIRGLLLGKFSWESPAAKAILAHLAQIVQDGWANNNAASIPMLPDGANIFQSGDAAFAGTIISDAVNWSQFGPALGWQNLGVMPWPVINETAPLAHKFSGIEGSILGITRWTKHPTQAWEFVSWMAGPQNADLWVKYAQGFSLNRYVDKAMLPKRPQYLAIEKIISNPTLHAGVMLSAQEQDALSRGWEEIAAKEITVNQWAGQMEAALKATPPIKM